MQNYFMALLMAAAFTGAAQQKEQPQTTFSHQVITGYGVNNLGKSGHLLYGLQRNQNLLYGGLRFQENAFSNLFDPTDYEVYRHDKEGHMLGLIVGFQRNFELPHSAITPLAAFDFEYAYLNSRENIGTANLATGQINYDGYEDVPARSLFLPSLNVGFEARIYKNIAMKQVVGATALFDSKWRNLPYVPYSYARFNGIGFNLRLSLLYRF